MTTFISLNFRIKIVLKAFLFSSFLLYAGTLFAQSVPDLSGEWILDNSKSDALFKDYIMTSVIHQTAETILIEDTFVMTDGREIKSPANTYTLDGKVSIKEEQGGTDKKSAKWSPDNKSLLINITRTVGTNDYGSNIAYTLSENGNVLTVQTTDINPSGAAPVIQVFNRR